ncbi:MAG: glycosyltransferase, partial [Marinobacter sp.]|nr:glycosyltransferase [Marinobacter sp.]
MIISTYNSPEWLEKVLWGYSAQTHKDFEIIIADDGSKDETRQLIDRMRDETGLTITHVWQEDDGFQKCRILNKAVLNTT